ADANATAAGAEAGAAATPPGTGAPATTGSSAPSAAQQNPQAPATSPQPAAGSAPATPPATGAPAGSAAAAPDSGQPTDAALTPLTKPPKPPREMTNKEVIDWGGQERFMRFRGNLVPTGKSKDASLDNTGFIKKYGMDEFLKTRGDLKMADQQRQAPA